MTIIVFGVRELVERTKKAKAKEKTTTKTKTKTEKVRGNEHENGKTLWSSDQFII